MKNLEYVDVPIEEHAGSVVWSAPIELSAGVDPSPPDRALPEEDIIESGWGWCNEQARVLVGLAQVAGVPGRLVGIYSSAGPKGHMSTELYVEGKWAWACPRH